MKIASLVLVLALSPSVVGCIPINPSPTSVAGDWEVSWSCGNESLTLSAAGTYTHTIKFVGGDQESDSGSWVIKPKTGKFVGATLILQNALDYCSAFGEKIDHPKRQEIPLDTVWEWGRTVLIFNPDLQGYVRK
jgi:hypothetical protein